jgi:hypothetical protein
VVYFWPDFGEKMRASGELGAKRRGETTEHCAAGTAGEPLLDGGEGAARGRDSLAGRPVPPIRRHRRRWGGWGGVVVLGVVCVGCAVVTQPLWEARLDVDAHRAQKGTEQALHQILRGNPVLVAESKDVGTPVVEAIVQDYPQLRASGGQVITIRGKNFGDEDADVSVKIGATVSDQTRWESPHSLLVKTPPGVGAHLDVAVSVQEPGEPRKVGVQKAIFAYSPPYVYDISPFVVGQPLMGPQDITIRAYGVGLWDTKPVAYMNGHMCGQTRWVDNQTVICSIKEGMRMELQNPEVKVAGQRSHCGIIVAGVCTVSVGHGSIDSVARIKEEIKLLKERGGDINELKKKLQRMNARKGIWLEKNSDDKPCDRMENCYPQSVIQALVSAVLMFMGLGSMLLILLMLRPLSMWIQKEFFEEEEELDENDPANALALRAREFDSRLTFDGL